MRARADGYTLLLAGSFNTINATLYDKLNFNFIRDIAPVASVMRYPYVMVVNPSLPAKSVPLIWRRPAAAVATTLRANYSR